MEYKIGLGDHCQMPFLPVSSILEKESVPQWSSSGFRCALLLSGHNPEPF